MKTYILLQTLTFIESIMPIQSPDMYLALIDLLGFGMGRKKGKWNRVRIIYRSFGDVTSTVNHAHSLLHDREVTLGLAGKARFWRNTDLASASA